MAAERLRYDFTFIGGPTHIYIFKTDKDVVYEVTFTPTPYLFDEEFDFATETFELSMLVTQNESGRLPTFDRLTARTLATIFSDFFIRSDDTITLYICASDDGRQLLRQRLFHRWFDYFEHDDYTRIDAAIRDSSGITYPITLIFKQTNPRAPIIAAEFLRIINGYSSGK